MKSIFIKSKIIVFALIILLSSTLVKAQYIITKNDTVEITSTPVIIKLGEYRGDLQWERSTDKLNWESITEEINDSITIVNNESWLYRAKVIAGNCPAFYSDTVLIKYETVITDGIVKVPENMNIDSIIIESAGYDTVPDADGKFRIKGGKTIKAINKTTGKTIYIADNPYYIEMLRGIDDVNQAALKNTASNGFVLDENSTANFLLTHALMSIMSPGAALEKAYLNAYDYVDGNYSDNIGMFADALEETIIETGEIVINLVENVFNSAIDGLLGCTETTYEEFTGHNFDLSIPSIIDEDFNYADQNEWFKEKYSPRYLFYYEVTNAKPLENNRWELTMDIYNGNPYFMAVTSGHINAEENIEYTHSAISEILKPYNTAHFVNSFTSCEDLVKTTSMLANQVAVTMENGWVGLAEQGVKDYATKNTVNLIVGPDNPYVVFFSQKASKELLLLNIIHQCMIEPVSELINTTLFIIDHTLGVNKKIVNKKDNTSKEIIEKIFKDYIVKAIVDPYIDASVLKFSSNPTTSTFLECGGTVLADFSNYLQAEGADLLIQTLGEAIKPLYGGAIDIEQIFGKSVTTGINTFNLTIGAFKQGSKFLASGLDAASTIYLSSSNNMITELYTPVRLIEIPSLIGFDVEDGQIATNTPFTMVFDEAVRLGTSEERGDGFIPCTIYKDGILVGTIDDSQISFNDDKTRANFDLSNLLQINQEYLLVVSPKTLYTLQDGIPSSNISHSFKVNIEFVNTPPTAPVLSTPINNGNDQIITPQLSWTASTDTDSDPIVYDVYLGTESTPVTVVSADQSALTYVANSLVNSTIYYWKVEAKDGNGGVAESEVWSFTTKQAIGLPILTTNAISNIEETVATSGGNITDNGGAAVTMHGVCYSTSTTPTITDNKTSDGTGTGTFVSNLIELTANTTYYVRAYATNSEGTAYGNEQSFTTTQVSTEPVVNSVSPLTATIGTETTFTVSGVNLTSDLLFHIDDLESKTFVSLSVDKTQFLFKGMPSNFAGTKNGVIKKADATELFTFLVEFSESSTGTLTDIDGNTYQTVTIGTQEWMAENLKVSHYPDGTVIPLVTDNTVWGELGDNNTDDAYCYYNNDANGEETYGALYTYAAALDACPTDWHLPTDAEWKILEMYLGMDQADTDLTGWRGTIEGTKLKAISGWNSSGNGTDDYGFSAFPGGSRYHSNGVSNYSGVYGYWWSGTEENSIEAYYRVLQGNGTIYRENFRKSNGYTVRCVRN